MKKKLMYICGLIYLSVAAMLVFGANLSAYIDPSVATYLIQAIAGVVIAVGAAVGIYWRKAKEKVAKTLNIDENKNKDVESDEIEISEEEPAEKK
ncbi:MAG: hypothetical protein KBT46_02330 [Ruminococcus sp.]|nr:hypothetical protein [Candidatus Copronaster equi]